MKAYVIKNKEGKYLGVSSSNYEHYWTTIDFAHYFRFLNGTHDAKQEAEEFRDRRYPDCEVVAITIAEGDLEEENKQLEEQHDLLIDEFQKERENLCKQIKQESDARERFVEKVKQLKQQLEEKDKEIGDLRACEFIATTLDFNKLSADNCRLRKQLEEKEKEIAELKEKRYTYNCLSFVSNNSVTEVAKYMEELQRTIERLSKECDSYVVELVEKDKEIEELKAYKKGSYEKYVAKCSYLQQQIKDSRKEVCDEIRMLVYPLDIIKDEQSCAGKYVFEIILDQIEKGEIE